MRKVIVLLMVAGTVFFLGIACGGGDEEEKGKFTEISVEEPTETVEPEEAETVMLPTAPVYEPKKKDVLVQLDDVLGAAEDTLGWDNVYCSITLDKSVSLLEVLRPSFSAGSTNLGKCDSAVTDLGNIQTTLDAYIMEGKGLDPTSTEAEGYKKKIRAYRDWIRSLLYPASPKEPIPEWKGDLMKKKWNERGEMMKKKWAERNQ
jgi:hypothetical protein